MDKIEELKKRIGETHLVISRVPKDTKAKFIELANAEFCGDYGMLLKFIFEEAIEYQRMKLIFFDNIDLKLNYLIEKANPPEETNSKADLKSKEIKLLNGRTIIVNKPERRED